MRVSILLLGGSALLLAACSDAGDSSAIRRREGSDTPTRAAPVAEKAPNDGSRGGSNSNPTPAPADPPPATPDAGPTTPPPATPPAPAPAGACTNPKCFAAAGFAGCKATDGDGVAITMGCQDGACACLAGNQTTSTFQGDADSAAEAAQLFLANCECQSQ